jgi:hypothetical protein
VRLDEEEAPENEAEEAVAEEMIARVTDEVAVQGDAGTEESDSE